MILQRAQPPTKTTPLSGSRSWGSSTTSFPHHAALVAAWWSCLSVVAVLGAETVSSTQVVAAARADLSLGAAASSPLPASAQAIAKALAHYASALCLESDTCIREALPHYQAVLQTAPENSELAYYAAELALNYADRASALQLLKQNILQAPQTPGPWLNLAHFHTTYPSSSSSGKSDPAGDALREALQRFPRSAEVLQAAVLHELRLDRRSQGMKLLEQAKTLEISSPDYWLAIGRVAQEVWPLAHPELRAAHIARVNPYFARAQAQAEKSPAQPHALHAVAQFYVISNQLPLAEKVAEKLVKVERSAPHLKLLGRLYEASKSMALVVPLLEEALTLEPADVETHRLLAQHYMEKEADYPRAIPHMEALVQLAGQRPEDYLSLGLLHNRCQQPERSLLLSKRAQALFPNNPRFYLLSAESHRALQHSSAALADFEKAETLARVMQPDLLSADFYTSWADLLQRTQRYDDAAKKYQRAISLVQEDEPQNAANILNNLGYMWLEQGTHLDQAGDFISRAVKLEPTSPIYLDSLGWYSFLKKDYPQALEALLRAEKLFAKPEEQDAEILDHIAQTYEQLTQLDNAETYYRRAVKNDPKNSAIQQRLKQLLSRKR
jgi:tetratricopeptide (TPR) repeat protein